MPFSELPNELPDQIISHVAIVDDGPRSPAYFPDPYVQSLLVLPITYKAVSTLAQARLHKRFRL
jgi:hypothetical protein